MLVCKHEAFLVYIEASAFGCTWLIYIDTLKQGDLELTNALAGLLNDGFPWLSFVKKADAGYLVHRSGRIGRHGEGRVHALSRCWKK